MLKKAEMTRVNALVSELESSGITVSSVRERKVLQSKSLAEFFGSAFGITLSEKLAGAGLSISIAENNKAIKAANRDGEQTTRTRLIRYLTDPNFIARDGVKFADAE